MLRIGEGIVNGGQIGMLQVREQAHFAVEAVGGLNDLLDAEAPQVDLFDGYDGIALQCIYRFIDSAEAAGSDLRKNTIALL